jgi:azurin
MKLARYTKFLEELDTVWVGSDFTEDQTDITFVDTVTDTGTALVGDAVNGVMVLTPSDGTVADNDEVYLASANELFKYGTNREIYGKCKLQFAETTTGVYNVAFGFQNAVGANSIVDTTGLPKVSGSALVIYKTTTTNVWKVASSCNGTAVHTTSTAAAVAATEYVLEIIVKDWDSVSMQVVFKVDGNYLKDSNGIVIKHTVAIANATEMQVWVGAKLGAATNNDTTSVDYIYGSQTRV